MTPVTKPRLPGTALAEETEDFIPDIVTCLSPQRATRLAGQGYSSTLQQVFSFNAHTLSLRCRETDGKMESKGKHLVPLNLSDSRQWFPSSRSSPATS